MLGRRRRRPRSPRHPRLRPDGAAIAAVPTLTGRIDALALELLDAHPDYDRSAYAYAYAWVGAEDMGDGIYCASIYTGTAADSPYMWIADMVKVAGKTGQGRVEGEEERFLLCLFVGDADGREEEPAALFVAECGPRDLATEVLRLLDAARSK